MWIVIFLLVLPFTETGRKLMPTFLFIGLMIFVMMNAVNYVEAFKEAPILVTLLTALFFRILYVILQGLVKLHYKIEELKEKNDGHKDGHEN